MIKWFFGYQCDISHDVCGHGHIFVPRWHPVRVSGFDDRFIFMYRGEWIVPIEECNDFYEMLNQCWQAASNLRELQDEWDQLSPYEREYRVW